MENAVFLSDTAENPYSSLPRYGAEESTMVFDDDEQDVVSHHSVNTEESLAFASSEQAGSTQPLHVKDRLYKKKNNPKQQQQQQEQQQPWNSRDSRNSSLRGYCVSRTINIPESFGDEIRPPSLFSPDIPPAPSEMQGPVKYSEQMVNTPSMFVASRDQRAAVAVAAAPQTNRPEVARQFVTVPQPPPPQFVVPVQMAPPQPVYVTQSNQPLATTTAAMPIPPLTGYKVPGSIATSLAEIDYRRAVLSGNKAKAVKVNSPENAQCWKRFLFLTICLVALLVLGAAVAAIILTQV